MVCLRGIIAGIAFGAEERFKLQFLDGIVEPLEEEVKKLYTEEELWRPTNGL
jgi:hypothetical protein